MYDLIPFLVLGACIGAVHLISKTINLSCLLPHRHSMLKPKTIPPPHPVASTPNPTSNPTQSSTTPTASTHNPDSSNKTKKMALMGAPLQSPAVAYKQFTYMFTNATSKRLNLEARINGSRDVTEYNVGAGETRAIRPAQANQSRSGKMKCNEVALVVYDSDKSKPEGLVYSWSPMCSIFKMDTDTRNDEFVISVDRDNKYKIAVKR